MSKMKVEGWSARYSSFGLLLIIYYIIVVPSNAITVNPNKCPTNKLAPHRKIGRNNEVRSRTFAAFYDLLLGDGAPIDRPTYSQQDEPDDECDKIEDYDENVNGLPQNQDAQVKDNDKRFFFGLLNQPPFGRPPTTPAPSYSATFISYPPWGPNWGGGNFGNPFYPSQPPYYPGQETNEPTVLPPKTTTVSTHQTYKPGGNGPDQETQESHGHRPTKRPGHFTKRTTTRPPTTTTTTKTYPPTKPPYWSGGYFDQNLYRPPADISPSDSLKPVFETEVDAGYPNAYQPGSSGHVAGLPQVKPSKPDEIEAGNQQVQVSSTIELFSGDKGQEDTPPNRRRPKYFRNTNNNNVFGSFIDLLL